MKLALIDGDILCYRIGFAAEDAEEKYCSARVNEFLTDLMIFDLADESDDYEGYLSNSSADNFRVNIAVTLPYKGNRTGKRPKHYDAIRKHLVDEWGFIMVYGEEADDAIAKMATKYRDTSIIVSIDKDLDQVPGWHYNFVKRHKYYVTDDEGFSNFAAQLLTGDRADNISGIRGVGPVKARRILSETTSPQAQLNAVSEVYREHDKGTIDRFRENCYLLWLRRQSNGGKELIDKMLQGIV